MNSRKVSIVAASVAAALAASPAFSLDKLATVNAPVQLVIAGASAARDAFQVVIAQELCASGLTVYRSSSSDFRAYSCTLVAGNAGGAAGTIPKILADQGIGSLNATFYYRSEGGSVWGPGSIVAKNLNPAFPGIKGLKIDPNSTDCADPVNVNYTIGNQTLSLPTSTCTVAGYAFATDTFTSGALEDKQTQFGVSDVEPKMFSGANYPQSSKFPQPYTVGFGAALAALPAETAFGQVFGILVNTTGAGSGAVTNLTSAQVASIFSVGGFTNWSQLGQPAGAIRKARREPGSGTQAAVAARFLHQNCGDSYNFVVQGGATTEYTSSSALNTALSTANTIGLTVYSTVAPANSRFVTIDGVAPSVDNVINGTYDLAYELTTAKATDPAILGSGSANKYSLEAANALQQILKRLDSIPDAPSVFAIPSTFNAPGQVSAVNSNKKTHVATRLGNSCVPFQAQ